MNVKNYTVILSRQDGLIAKDTVFNSWSCDFRKNRQGAKKATFVFGNYSHLRLTKIVVAVVAVPAWVHRQKLLSLKSKPIAHYPYLVLTSRVRDKTFRQAKPICFQVFVMKV
jgi:hypothetical protein